MRLIDADLLRKNMEFICMGIMAGTDPYDAPLTEIDNAPNERPQADNFDVEDFKKFVESRLDMQDLYLPIHFFDLLDEYCGTDKRGGRQ